MKKRNQKKVSCNSSGGALYRVWWWNGFTRPVPEYVFSMFVDAPDAVAAECYARVWLAMWGENPGGFKVELL